MGKIFYLMGKSASGKDSIYKELKVRMPELKTIVIYTTRPIREGERDGVEYHFVTEDVLQQLQQDGKVIELRAYDTVHGIWKYFTADDGQFDAPEDYLAIGTLESYGALICYFGQEKVVPIYIEVEDGIRLQRALERERMQKTPRYEELCRRFLADAQDFSTENLEKMGISRRFQNQNMEKCIDEIMLCIQDSL